MQLKFAACSVSHFHCGRKDLDQNFSSEDRQNTSCSLCRWVYVREQEKMFCLYLLMYQLLSSLGEE